VNEPTKYCPRCGGDKPESAWSPSQWTRSSGWCRACHGAYQRANYKPSKDPRHYPETPEGQSYCGRCQSIQPDSEFYGTKVKNWCKTCYREWHRERYTPKNGANDEPRECLTCGKTYQPKQRQVSAYCSRACREQDRRDSGRWRETYLQRTYGIGSADYERILAEQGGGCALCGIKPEELTTGRYRTYLHVDHCHDTGRVRGLLCPDHNLLLGRFGDDVVMFRRVVEYLEAA